MGIVAKPPPLICSSSSSSRKKTTQQLLLIQQGSMSGQHQQEFHEENLFVFTNGFDRSTEPGLQAHHHDQIRPKLRSGFDPAPPTSTLVGIDHANPTAVDPSTTGLHPVYETAGGMLSEMFSSFEPGPGPGLNGPGEMTDYRRVVGGLGPEWYGARQVIRGNQDNHHLIPSVNAANVAAMQLFLTNSPPRSPSPPQQPPPGNSNSTVHMHLPSPSSIPPGGVGGGFHSNLWSPHITHTTEIGRIVEGQGLSLSLSSSLQHLESGKQPDDDTHNMFFNQHQQHLLMQPNPQPLTGPFGPGPGPSSTGQHQPHQFGFGPAALSSSSLGMINVLRNSKYAKPAQELLEEFCSVGKGHPKKSKLSRQNSVNPTRTTSGGGAGTGSTSSTRDPPPLLAADRIEHQRRKVKLLSMLDEVGRRYNNYCEQMQMVVNSLDLAMGYGAATPYTALAQKAMSRHFRCLKDAIQEQLKQSYEVLGEKNPTATSGLSKGETPRLKVLEQSLRQQRAFHQMGLMEQEAWRPQRGLPERSVNILRAWLFEHFLHPYPNDADKHMLARQTGLSRNQVSNWFINARVRLWKPMVEEMYQQESKELEEGDIDFNQTSSSTSNTNNPNPNLNPNPNTNSFVAEQTMTSPDSDPTSSLPTTINRGHHHHHQQPLPPPQGPSEAGDALDIVNVGPHTMIRFGTASGDVSLTLGLRHAGNGTDKSTTFSVREFGMAEK